jgi:copper homeostasis protein
VTLLEICCEDVEGAAIAELAGADRVELCANLAQGGTTPGSATISAALGSINHVGLQVLIRPRPGDFAYEAAEIETMAEDIEVIGKLPRPAGVTLGFVIGALTGDRMVDVPTCRTLLDACASAPVTFHRAFDDIANQDAALETLIGLGFQRVLSSGGAPTALEGADALAALVRQAAGRISILAAGSIRAPNAVGVVRRTGVGEIHLRAPRSAGSTSTSAEVIRAVLAALAEER